MKVAVLGGGHGGYAAEVVIVLPVPAIVHVDPAAAVAPYPREGQVVFIAPGSWS